MEKTTWDELFAQETNIWRDPDPFAKAFLEKLSRGQRLLDMGCGCGRHVVLAAKLGMKVTGVDESQVGLRYTKNWLLQERLDANLILASFDSLPFPSESFDAIVSTYCLNHGTSNDVRNYFQEIDRVLVKGGKICIVLNAAGDYREGLGDKLDELTYVLPAGPEAGIPHCFSTEEFARSLLEFAGQLEIALFSKPIAELEKTFGRKMQLYDHPAVLEQMDPRVSHWLIRALK